MKESDVNILAKKLAGLQVVDTIAKTLGVSRRTAINYISRLRKKGLVKTTYGRRKIRMYRIYPFKKPEFGYPGLYETINKYSPVKLIAPYEHRLARKLIVEEAIARAVKTERFRVVLASLGMFSKVKDWSKLYYFAKKESIERKIGALYDVARTCIKIRRMDKRTRDNLLKSKQKGRYIIDRIRGKHFKKIEKRWKVYIPFNKADLGMYKE